MMLDFIATLIREKLIEPNWYYNDASQKTSFAGKIGIEWYPGEISENTQSYFNRNNITDPATGKIVDTTDWWHTYTVPKAPGCENGGFQPSDGFLGQIITVSAKASNDEGRECRRQRHLQPIGRLQCAALGRGHRGGACVPED